jgi:predicted AAA+ superfamily ATPase
MATFPKDRARTSPATTRSPRRVIGMRRAGKTTFLHQLRRERHAQGIGRERLPYVNFEDEQLTGLQVRQIGVLVEELYRQHPDLRGNARVTWCFDEIQVVPVWERFVRRLLDDELVEVFVSGSSAALLSREIATAMRGRAWEVLIHPFGFAEYVLHHGEAVPEAGNALASPSRSRLEGLFGDYLRVGGFPEAQGLEEATRHGLLRDYVDVALMRDIVERHKVSNRAASRVATAARGILTRTAAAASAGPRSRSRCGSCRAGAPSAARGTGRVPRALPVRASPAASARRAASTTTPAASPRSSRGRRGRVR